MKTLWAFLKKEWLDALRNGKVTLLFVLFLLFGIMNPAIAKLTPFMFDMLSDTFAESGIAVNQVDVNALTSWTQFFKNIPIGLIAFVFIFSNIFVKEYESGTLVLVLTKGLERYKVVIAKSALVIFGWSLCYLLSFGVTYLYNAYFWDNGIVVNLIPLMLNWWLFGVWIVSLLVFFSTFFSTNAVVLLGIGATVVLSYFVGLFKSVGDYLPTKLMDTSSLAATNFAEFFSGAIIITAVISSVCIFLSVILLNKKQI